MNEITDQSPVPIRWVFASLSIAGASMVSVIIGAFTVGSSVTKLSLGQEDNTQRISAIEQDRIYRIREGETFQKKVLEDLTEIKTTLRIKEGDKK